MKTHRLETAMQYRQTFACLVAWAAAISMAGAQPIGQQLSVYPDQVHLTSARDTQRLLAITIDDDGVTRDVTGQLDLTAADPALVEWTEEGVLRPLSDGMTEITASWQGQAVQIPVSVEQAHQQPPTSFRLDVIPVITRAGCNTGTCHGSARGKDGFGLSLFGFDPAGDYHRITRELAARRINLAVPSASLLLEKSIGAVSHTGGKRFAADELHYETIHRWLEEGARDDPESVPHVERIALYPPEIVLQGTQQHQQLLVVAHYSDGTDRDITHLAVYLSSDDAVAPVTPDGQITGNRRGESFVTARFETHTVGIPILVLPEHLDYTPPAVTGNYIDQLVAEKLRKLRVPPSPRCGDEEFLRRVTLDVIGLLPTELDYAKFLADEGPDKRTIWIERLLERKEFADLWAAKWADLLMIRQINNRMSEKAVLVYFNWLRNQIASGVPLDEMVRQLLAASGHTFTEPAANFYAVERNKLKVAENVAQIFLGIRTQCAQCHNHPFDRWTMDDYYGFAAFFTRVGRKPHEDYRQWIIFNGGGETRHPVTKQVVAPKFLGGDVPEIAGGKDRRKVVSEWLTSPENPYFARTTANRIWAHFLGRGIIDPVDDVRVSNPPGNANLLDTLAAKLIDYEYDFRRLAFDIVTSETYQRSSQTVPGNVHDNRNFAHATVRRIPAVNLLDCLSQVTEAPSKYPRLPLGTRAVQTPDHVPGNYFLKTFGRASRGTACACETNSEPTLSQALHLLNGNSVHDKIQRGKVVARLLQSQKSPAEVLDSIYMRCLSRLPTVEEEERLLSSVSQAENPREGLEDVFWAVLNSREFLFVK